eukprot:CAMPEP_0117026460 /NCGR_PEP_ID=MMETSP0472-20121206/19452_1 /TAXON_ID=693140 ORGANISM="Tiarina fusus, Strain LIS" /NCGR_SAMPLE_ID=MMETSP0472 /ASSEMBLY_ACC=CAM_ASM_000603 /LENGTH=441 /DNA_ID=CAMNT_0004733475 /DNA_START=6 /DNA_END=1331 /DNA_ORIENTATION=-
MRAVLLVALLAGAWAVPTEVVPPSILENIRPEDLAQGLSNFDASSTSDIDAMAIDDNEEDLEHADFTDDMLNDIDDSKELEELEQQNDAAIAKQQAEDRQNDEDEDEDEEDIQGLESDESDADADFVGLGDDDVQISDIETDEGLAHEMLHKDLAKVHLTSKQTKDIESEAIDSVLEHDPLAVQRSEADKIYEADVADSKRQAQLRKATKAQRLQEQKEDDEISNWDEAGESVAEHDPHAFGIEQKMERQAMAAQKASKTDDFELDDDLEEKLSADIHANHDDSAHETADEKADEAEKADEKEAQEAAHEEMEKPRSQAQIAHEVAESMEAHDPDAAHELEAKADKLSKAADAQDDAKEKAASYKEYKTKQQLKEYDEERLKEEALASLSQHDPRYDELEAHDEAAQARSDLEESVADFEDDAMSEDEKMHERLLHEAIME